MLGSFGVLFCLRNCKLSRSSTDGEVSRPVFKRMDSFI